MTIVMTNGGILIAEEYYDTDDANEAIREFASNDDISFAEGDVIEIRR